MKWVHVTATVFMLALAGLAQANPQQLLSPPGTAQLTLGTTRITIAYSRPKIRDPKTGGPRKIMGGLVPFGKVWRAGANEATALTTTSDLTIGGAKIPAGKYTLFAVPEPSRWTLIVSRKTGEWGIPYPGAQYDFARIPMTVESLDRIVAPSRSRSSRRRPASPPPPPASASPGKKPAPAPPSAPLRNPTPTTTGCNANAQHLVRATDLPPVSVQGRRRGTGGAPACD